MSKYSIKKFIDDAKATLESDRPLADKQADIGKRLLDLSERDDLTSLGAIIGPSDASTNSFLLWREPPAIALVVAQFDPLYRSPVHEHGDHWVISAGYRGCERWDVYERVDDRSRPGRADLVLKEQPVIERGVWYAMPPAPRSVHSHNNIVNEFTRELIFSAVPPIPASERLIFDPVEGTCFPSWFGAGQQLVGDTYPPR